MGKVKIPYYVIIKGRGYWRPKKSMREVGFSLVRCGADGPEAWKIAQSWADKWERVRRGQTQSPAAVAATKATREDAEAAIIYPCGSLGEAFAEYRLTPEWKRKEASTRDDWWRGWKRIRPIFGDVAPRTITLAQVSVWRQAIEDNISLREAHRALKIFRALWKVAAALKYCDREGDPSLIVANSAAKGRTETWSEGEAVRLAKGAWRVGYCALSVVLAIMWDGQLSPVDARSLVAGQLARRRSGLRFFTDREKTGKTVGIVLSKRATRLLDAYLAQLGYELLDEAPLFRSRGLPVTTARGGRARPGVPYTKDILSGEFREVRALIFGPLENRKMMDFRRSGAVEAIVGGAQAEHLAHAMGNTLNVSNALYETYVPANEATVRQVADARRIGRRKLREEND